MEPLYDANVNLVGWIEPGHHIFDTNMNWLAYVAGDHAWSANGGNWCGPVVDATTCLDRSGRVVGVESASGSARNRPAGSSWTAGKTWETW